MTWLRRGVVLGAMFFAVATTAEAATLYMDPYEASLNRGDTMSVSIRLDTDEGECVNTVDAVIHYTENIIPIDTSRGSSIMSIWLEDPKIDKANRTITFAGGIPNGYCGRITGDPRLTNRIVELVFAAPGFQIGASESGDLARVTFGDGTRVLLNDGFGTDAPLRLFDSTIALNQNQGGAISNEWAARVSEDEQPPEQFSISLERTTNAFSNRYFIVFNTTDKQSGVDYYEVIEEPLETANFFNWGAEDAPWVRAESPYLLKDQSLNSTIRVRAFDKAGNSYVATLVPEESARTLSNQNKLLLALLIGGGILLILIVLTVVLFRRRRRDLVDDEEQVDEE